jgi:hypothetical protein
LVGTPEFSKVNSPLLYPNPISEMFIIINIDIGAKRFTVKDVSGKSVLQKPVNSSSVNVSCRDLNNGIFFYQISDKTGQIIHKGKFIVNKD